MNIRRIRSQVVLSFLALLAPVAGCRQDPPIPSTTQEINRVLMEPDSETKVRQLLELTEASRKNVDYPAMRKTLDAAMKSAAKIEDPVVRAELLTKIAEPLTKENWKTESYEAISAAQIAAQTIPDLSKKIAALTELAMAMHRAGDNSSAESAIVDAELTVNGVTEPELRVPLLAAISAACTKLGDRKQAPKFLKDATTLAATIKDPIKRTSAEYHASSACFQGELPADGKAFYESAVKSAEEIKDPAAKAKTLLNLVDTLHPYRKQLPIEIPLQTAIAAAGEVADEKEKKALLARAQALPKLPKEVATPTATKP